MRDRVTVPGTPLREQGITDRWRGLRDALTPSGRVTATLQCADGRTLHGRNATRAEPGQRAIDEALAIDPAAAASATCSREHIHRPRVVPDQP